MSRGEIGSGDGDVISLVLLLAGWGFAPADPSPVDLSIVTDVRGVHTFEFVIDPHRPPFRFEFVGDANNQPVAIRCYLPAADSAFQLLEVPFETPYRNAEYFSVVDMNRDGYNDLKVLTTWGVTGNEQFAYYLWNPSTSRFDESEDYWVCRDPTDAHGCCTSHAVGGMAGNIFADAVYCPERGRLVMVRRVWQDWNADDRCFHKTIEERRDGQLEEVSTEIVCDPTWQR